MPLDETSVKQLQARGALVGFTNADHWERLVRKHGMGSVCWAVGKARATLKRQPSWQQVEAELPKQPAAAVEASAEISSPSPSVAPIRIAKPPAAVEVDDQVDEQLEHEPAPAPRPQPATERKNVRVDWREILREHPGTTKNELAEVAGGTRQGIHVWLSSHRAEVVDCGTGNDTQKPRRYWLKGAAGAPEARSAPGSTPDECAAARLGAAMTERPCVAVKARQKPDPRPSSPTPPPAAPEACAAPCSGCQRLGVELAKVLVESDELGRELARLQATATRPTIPPKLLAELDALREQLLEAKEALAAIPKA